MRLFDFSKTIKFQSPFSIEETQEVLTKVTANLIYSDLAPSMRFMTMGPTDGLLFSGRVSKNKVKLSRVRKYMHNSFKPYFYGKFVYTDNKLFLQGKFTMHTFVKVFLSLSMIFLAVWCMALIFGTIDNINSLLGQIIIKLITLSVIVGLSILFNKVIKKFGEGDIEWIKARLKELSLTEVI